MAETDVQPEVAPEEVPAQETTPKVEEDPEARYRYDDSLLIKVKGRVKRPAKPDEAERSVVLGKLQAEITKQSDRIKEIKQIVEEKKAARGNAQSGNKAIIQRLQAIRSERDAVVRQKQGIREELQHVNQRRDVLREQQRQLREELRKNRTSRNVTIDNLDDEIRQLEFKLAHETNTDPRKLENDLRELNALRPKLREMGQIEAQLKETDDTRKSISARLSDCDAVLQEVRSREDAENAALDERKQQEDGGVDIPTLNAEKQECWEIIQVLRDKMTQVRSEFNDKWQEYVKLDKNYNAYMRHVKHQEYLERQKAREARATENEEVDPDAPVSAPRETDTVVMEAYASEIFTLEQLMLYLRKLVPEGAADKAGASAEEKKALEAPQGMKLLKKQEDEFMVVAKKKKPQGKKGAPEPAPAAPKTAEPAKKKLNHSLEILKTFMTFGLEVPQTTAELAGTIEKAEAKKAEFLEKRKRGKEAPKPAPKKEEPAAEEAAPEPEAAEAEFEAAASPVPEPEAVAPAEPEPEAAAPAEPEPEAAAPAEPEPEAAAPAEPESSSKPEEPASAEGASKKKKKKKNKGANSEEPSVEAAAVSGDGVALAVEVDASTQSVSVRLNVSA